MKKFAFFFLVNVAPVAAIALASVFTIFSAHAAGWTDDNGCNPRRGRRECLPVVQPDNGWTNDNGCNPRRGRRECLPVK